MTKRIKGWVSINRFTLIAAIVPAIIILLIIHHYAVNVPISDQYALVPMIQSINHGHIPLGALWAQHNEHRIFFPNLILVSLAKLTHWNTITELYASFLIGCIGFFGIFLVFVRKIKEPSIQIMGSFIVALMFFITSQGQNWLWGWQLEWFLSVACIIWSLNLIDKQNSKTPLKYLVLPGAIALIASFSLGNGLMVWAGGLIIFILKRFRLNQYIAWIAGAIISTFLYFYHYTFLDSHALKSMSLKNLDIFFSYLGRPISGNTHIALSFGILFFILFIVLAAITYLTKDLAKMSVFIALGVISITTGLLIAVTRYNYGITGALSSVYVTDSLLLIISIVALAANANEYIWSKTTFSKVWSILLWTGILIIMPFVWLNGLSTMRTQHALDIYVYSCSRAQLPTQFCLYQMDSASRKDALLWVNYLKQIHYGGY